MMFITRTIFGDRHDEETTILIFLLPSSYQGTGVISVRKTGSAQASQRFELAIGRNTVQRRECLRILTGTQ